MPNTDKALVLGGDGLLGSHLVRKLIEEQFQVRVAIQPGSRSPTLDGLPVERLNIDLSAADESLVKAMDGCRFVFHSAAITNLWAPPEIVWRVNLDGTRRVVDACLATGVERLVFVGSASSFQYGSADAPGDEWGGFPEAYRGLAYMESKFEAMQLVRKAVDERGLDAVIVAPTFLLGDLDHRPSSGELIRQFLRRKMMFTSSGGRCFAYAPDVAWALLAAAKKGRPGRSYIGGGSNLTYMDFFTRVAQVAGTRPPRFVLPEAAVVALGTAGSLFGKLTARKPPLDRLAARLAVDGTYYSSARAIDELGMPQTKLEIAIEDSIRSLRDYGHLN